MSFNWDMACSVVTAGVAIVALCVSIKQIRLSNKQQLLDRRLRLWTKAYGLMESCKKVTGSCENADDLQFMYQQLTDNLLLRDIYSASWDDTAKDYELQVELLKKLQELKEMAFEIELVFKRDAGKALSMFVANYASLLMAIRRYQTIRSECSKKPNRNPLDQEKLVDGEKQYEAAKEKLLSSFKELSPRMTKKIASQCKLLWFSK